MTHFRELRQSYRNILVRFLVQMKTLKFACEINWPVPYLFEVEDEVFNPPIFDEFLLFELILLEL